MHIPGARTDETEAIRSMFIEEGIGVRLSFSKFEGKRVNEPTGCRRS